MMSWTVACFCGNIYITPPDCCEVCGRSTEPALEGTVAASQHLHTGEIATALVTTREPQPAPLPMRRDEKSSPARMAATAPRNGTASRRSPAASGRHWV
jgi:uncharacterized OB-fold protein